MAKAIVFGSMNMDLSIDAPRIPEAGETLAGSGFVANPGGKGANQAVAAARLGAHVHMLAAVGADGFGAELVRGLRADGIECSGVRTLDDVATGVAVIVRTQGENRIVLSPGANHAIGAECVAHDLRSIVEPGDVLMAQGECDARATAMALRTAHELGAFTLLNPAPARPVPPALWESVDLVCLNETECQIVCGILPVDDASCLAAARRLLGLGAGAVVITLGAAGSFGLARAGGPIRVAAEPVRVVDTTAAGDTFIGALAAARLRGLALEEAMRLGSSASALTVGRLGAQPSIPYTGELGGR